jgi:hypothetical protein
MDRDNEQTDELIDLGAVSIETLGPIGTKTEVSQIGHLMGISDE